MTIRLAGDRRVLHQLGRVPELEAAPGREHDAVPALRPAFGTQDSGDGGFSSGLLYANGKPKPAYAAYRLPLFLPVTSARRGRSLEVWGCVRPARYAILDAGQQPQTAQIQFARGGSGAFTTLRTVTISNPNNCYFDIRMKFPGSGTVRLAYTYPTDPLLLFPPAVEGATMYSRSVGIKLR